MLDSLFSPITINNRQLKNRCIVPAMVMNLCEEDGSCTERFAAYHEAKGKNLTTAMSLLQAFEGSGVFLCGYVVPFIAGIFGESARSNMMVAAVATMLIGLATYTFMRKAHGQVFANAQ